MTTAQYTRTHTRAHPIRMRYNRQCIRVRELCIRNAYNISYRF